MHLIATLRLTLRVTPCLLVALCGPVYAAGDLPDWLEGCWRRDGARSVTVERWLPPSGNAMLGVSETRRDGDTVAWEFLRIVSGEDGTRYVASPSGQRTTEFRRVPGEVGDWVFENAGHDFPQRIVYPPPVEGRLAARIEGDDDGEARVIEFPMQRVPCETPWSAPAGGAGEVAGAAQSG